jgi:hypothetical protein
MKQERGRSVCKVCGRKVVVVENHRLKRGDPKYVAGMGPMREAVHEGDEGGRKVVNVRPHTFTQLKVRLHERCEARRERAATAQL